MSDSRRSPPIGEPGTITPGQIPIKSRLEVSKGRPIYCAPTGGRGAKANTEGAMVLRTDPAVTEAGVDAGFAIDSKTLRAPDVSIGNVPNAPGWIAGVPALAVEYADTGQDEADLKQKLRELLRAGTKQVWVVRLAGPRRVEVHELDQKRRIAYPGEELSLPGVLANPVSVDALFGGEAALDASLRNLLQRKGFEDLDQVRAEGKVEGKAEGQRETLRLLIEKRFGALAPEQLARLDAADADHVMDRLFDVSSFDQLFE